MVDGIETPNYNNIDPNEIENIAILKDASATAVYGVRGANGVILITTRRGENGKPQVSFTTQAARTSFPFIRSNMNSYQYASSFNKALAYDSYITNSYLPMFTDRDIELYKNHKDPIFHPDIDWYDLILKPASYSTQSNQTIRGGAEKLKYFISLGYLSQNGQLNTAVNNPGYDGQIRYKRYNLRSNFDFDITKRLSASIDISTQIGNLRNPALITSTERFMETLSATPPHVSPGIMFNRVITLQTVTTSTPDPLIALQRGWNITYSNNLNGSVRLKYTLDFIAKGLVARGAVSYKNYNTQREAYGQPGVLMEARRLADSTIVYIPSGDEQVLSFGESVSKSRNTYAEVGFDYAQEFGNHNVTGLILYNQSKLFDPELSFLVPNGYQGLVGRITYNYKSRYLSEFNIGYNGTENFAPKKRFGFFPAYSLGWIASEEPFFPKNNIFTFMKIRGSYGEVGNDKIGGSRFLYLQTAYTYGSIPRGGYNFGETGTTYQAYQGSNEGKIGNPDLTWERAKKMNIGVELKLFQNKVSITADLFQENRDNILANKGTVPSIIAMDLPAYNLGKMKNSGFDGDITVNEQIGGFSYFIKANYTYAHNIIQFQDEVPRPFSYQNRTGQSYGQAFGYIAEGFFNSWEEVNDINRPVYSWVRNKIQPGDIRYKDVNGDGIINADDQVPIGYSNFPEVIFGLSLGGEYKGFDFSILFQGATNVSNWPSRRSTSGFYLNTGAGLDLYDKSWSYENYTQGLPIIYPHFSGATGEANMTHLHQFSTFWYKDATYLRLKNAEIGYTLSKGLITKLGLSSCRIFINGNNLLTWCNLLPGLDPEYANGTGNREPYPITRVYNLGLKVNF